MVGRFTHFTLEQYEHNVLINEKAHTRQKNVRLDVGYYTAALTFGRRFVQLRKTSTNGEPNAQPRPSLPVVANNATRRQGCRIGLEGH